jgi:uncharacterized repeat protein (TIGR03806 family)
MIGKRCLLLIALLLFSSACNPNGTETGVQIPAEKRTFDKLSDYRFFKGNGASQSPNAGVRPYDLNSSLFSDYTHKRRFVWVPPGLKIRYHKQESFEFPIGSTLIKTFSMFNDLRDPRKGEVLIETRLLVRVKEGWKAFTYLWNKEQNEAILEIAGESIDLKWIHYDGKERTNHYVIPNQNDCKSCHSLAGQVTPIGPKAKHLNRLMKTPTGEKNQLESWKSMGILADLPAKKSRPRLAVWNRKSENLESRARAYLDINCAHCHNPQGLGSNSGLDLRSEMKDKVKIGIMKSPVAAGRGSGGRLYDIVPGNPAESIMVFRMSSTDPGIAMPESGRGQNHGEGIQLIRDWITQLK